MDQTSYRPLLRTQADLQEMWRRMMSPLGFTSYSLWLVVIDGERPQPHVMEFADTPCVPSAEDAERLAGALEKFAGPDISFAFLRSRPGSGRPDESDLAWAQTLYDVGRRAGVRLAVTHLAHDDDIHPMPMDDLLAEPA
jgi:hypothetical protein